MVQVLPSRVLNYNTTAASPTNELIVIGQILSEVGDYACTTLDREHLSLARKCASKLKKVVSELIARHCIQSSDDLYEIQKGNVDSTDLSVMTIDELHRLYRQWPIRQQERLKKGRENKTYYYESQIVRELQSRKAATKEEQFKIDYCTATYNNELDNLSFIHSCPIKVDDNKIYPDSTKEYSPDELAGLIECYSHYRDVTEREILIEYVDIALDMLENKRNDQDLLRLKSEIAELGRENVIRVPEWSSHKIENLS